MYNIQEQCIISFILHSDWKQLKISKNLLGPFESCFFFKCYFNALYVASLPADLCYGRCFPSVCI